MECDALSFSGPGICPHCKMELIKRSDLLDISEPPVNEIHIEEGSGKFVIDGGFDPNKTITIFYHQPKSFTTHSQVLFTIPGAGRNAADYRNALIAASEKYGVLILSPQYAEDDYAGFWSYNLAGMIYDVNVKDSTFKINHQPNQWIFNDFDRIFDLVRQEINLKEDRYDMFGHSAGGQILHRLALFHPRSKANRILASNSGWYTLPIVQEPFPYGLDGIGMETKDIDFSSQLILFLGEKDDADETRGHLRRSPEVDKQGTHRFARGTYFFTAKSTALAHQKEFNWRLITVPNIGHEYQKMSKEAMEYLYKEITSR